MNERTFDTELEELNELILKMGGMVERSIVESIDALKVRDEELSKKVIFRDKETDRLENEIDDKCIELLATKQPVASDLRFITTAMKITTDLERIGDLAVDIAQKNIELLSQPLLKPLIDMPVLSEISQKMIRMSLDSFVKRDSAGLTSINDLEREADKLRDLITDDLIEIMIKDPATVKRAVPLMLVARHLERICDHAMNIAEDVVYMVEAKVVKHLHENKQADNKLKGGV
ncbi:MAG: phosphate signaling complex protein PhoU [Candidatus Margulisiibacteriota bacterium]